MLDSIKEFTMPVLRENNPEWYIEFYAFDPSLGQMRRKKIKVNRLKKASERRTYAKELIKRLTEQLMHGWNPCIEAASNEELRSFADVCNSYDSYINKMYADGLYRKETYAGYKSYLKNMIEYNGMRTIPIYYIYQFDRRFCQDLLDYMFIERNCSAQTRNNYLGFLRVFAGYCVTKCYLSHRVTDGIEPIPKRLMRKSRTVIPPEVVRKIRKWLYDRDRNFLLACYILYYCLIRPVEQTRLRIRDINVKESTITVPAEASKNRMEQTVTLPKKVLLYMVDMGLFRFPSDWFIFSDGLRPGRTQIDPKIFRDRWAKVKRGLKLRPEWKFYSLKDTGITEMLDKHTASISVRDQARHSSLEITELYTRHNRKANSELLNYDGSL